MKRLGYVFAALILLTGIKSYAVADETKHEINFSVDLYSKHMWRGIVNGNPVSIQPDIAYSYSGFSTGIWAAVSTDGSYSELDLYTTLTFNDFSVTLFDYYCPQKPVLNHEFFEIEQGKTRHTFDLVMKYSLPGKYPFSILVSTLFYGDDLNPQTGRNYYSTYIESAYNNTFHSFNFQAFAGLTPFAGYYSESPAFVNIGAGVSRKFSTGMKIGFEPKIKFAYNPTVNKGWISFGLNLNKLLYKS